MKIPADAKPLAIMVVAGWLLTGCVLSRPTVHTENWDVKGWPVHSFASGEQPAVVVENVADDTMAVVDVLSLPDRRSVRHVTMVGNATSTNPNVDAILLFREPLRGLRPGNYELELSVKGQVMDIQDFSVSGPPVSAGNSAAMPAPSERGVEGPDRVVDRLDRLLNLTPEQKTAVDKILADQDRALRAFVALDDRVAKGAPVRQEARAQVRALLTPSQREIYDDTPQRFGGGLMLDAADPQGAQFQAVRTYLGDFIKNSPAIAARLGAIAKVAPAGGFTSTTEVAGEDNGAAGPVVSIKGSYRYNVKGGTRSETLTVSWEKASPSAPVNIIRIEGGDGAAIQP